MNATNGAMVALQTSSPYPRQCDITRRKDSYEDRHSKGGQKSNTREVSRIKQAIHCSPPSTLVKQKKTGHVQMGWMENKETRKKEVPSKTIKP